MSDVNQWNHLFQRINIMKSAIIGRVLQTLNEHIECPPHLIPYLGYDLMWYSEPGCSNSKENLLFLEHHQLDYLGSLLMNLKRLLPSELFAEYSALSQLYGHSPEVTNIELRWLKKSIQRMNGIFRDNQVDDEFIQAVIAWRPYGQQDNYYDINAKSAEISNLYQKRFNLFVGQQNLRLSPMQLQKLVSYTFIATASFGNVVGALKWATGYEYEQPGDGHPDLTIFPNYSIYDAFKQAGAFVHKKKEGLEFKEVVEKLLQFARIDHVANLFLFSLMYDHEDTRRLQMQYQKLLVKKLDGHTRQLEVKDGDEALDKLEHLFAKFLSLSHRITSDIGEHIQNA